MVADPMPQGKAAESNPLIRSCDGALRSGRRHPKRPFYEKRGFKDPQQTDLPKTFPAMAVDSKFYALSLS